MAKKVVTKETLKEFAKELYFEVDDLGKRIHSFRDICTKLSQKFHRSVSFRTILNWSKAENWDALFLKVKQYGIEKAQITVEQKENEIIEKQGNIHADIQKGHKEIYDLIQNNIITKIKEDPTIRFEALLKAFELTTNTLLKLNPVDEAKSMTAFEQLLSSLDEESKQKMIDRLGL